MPTRYHSAAGFTAVEVLITLIIAAILLGGGYQIYGIVIRHTADARERSVASNYAQEALQRKTAQTLPACNPTGAQTINNQLPAQPNLQPPIAMTATVTCPYGNGDSISQVTIRLKYGTPQKEVVHALYVRSDT